MDTTSAQTLMADAATSTNNLISSAMYIYIPTLGILFAFIALMWVMFAWKSIFSMISKYFK